MDNNGYGNNGYHSNWNYYNHIPERSHTEYPREYYEPYGERPTCTYSHPTKFNNQTNYIDHSLWTYNGQTQSTVSMQPHYNLHPTPMVPEMVAGSDGYIPTSNISSPSFPSDPHSTNDEADSSQRRTTFTKFQLQKLEERFIGQSFLNKEERIEFAGHLHLTERQVMIWFQNRRSRLKKRGPSDKAYHIKQLQDQKIMGLLKTNERVFPFFERAQQVNDGETFGQFAKND